MKQVFSYLSAALLLLAGLHSCEIPFDLEKTSEPKIYVQCIPAKDGETVLQVLYASPVTEADAPVSFHPSSIDIQVNGTRVGYETDDEGIIRCTPALEAGDKVSVTVQAEGMETASGSTTVPETPVIEEIGWEKVQVDTTEGTKVTFRLDKEPSEGDCFGLQIRRRTVVLYMDGSVDDLDVYITPGQLMSTLDAGSVSMENFLQVNYKDGLMDAGFRQPMTLLTAKQFQGREYSFYLDSFDADALREWMEWMEEMEDRENAEDWQDQRPPFPGRDGEDEEKEVKVPVATATACMVYLYRLSPELYLYAKALYQSQLDFLANMGLIPANFTYTNVEGGAGVVGALAGTSEMLTDVDDILKGFISELFPR
ncbi:MAG: DUF4249 family protein [Bacteroidales bacterium]|nr:DUF4249 family protein [Bacteroidales bacterium]